MNVAGIALTVALPVGLIGVVSLVIASVNSRRGSSTAPTSSDGALRRQRIGFPIRGVGFFMSQGNEIEDYSYAWPYVAKFCLGALILALAVAFVAWVSS